MALTAAEKALYRATAKSYNQRGRRLVAAGFERGPALPGLKNIQNSGDLSAALAAMRAWMDDPAHTITGARQLKTAQDRGSAVDMNIRFMMEDAQRQAAAQAAPITKQPASKPKRKRKPLTPEQKKKHAEAQKRYRQRKKAETNLEGGDLQLWKNVLKASGIALPPDKIDQFADYLTARKAQINDSSYYMIQAAAEEFAAMMADKEMDPDEMAEIITRDFEKWLIESLEDERVASQDLFDIDKAAARYSADAMHNTIMRATRRKK